MSYQQVKEQDKESQKKKRKKRLRTHSNKTNNDKQRSIKYGILPAYHDRQNRVDLPHFPVPLSLLLGERTPRGL